MLITACFAVIANKHKNANMHHAVFHFINFGRNNVLVQTSQPSSLLIFVDGLVMAAFQYGCNLHNCSIIEHLI